MQLKGMTDFGTNTLSQRMVRIIEHNTQTQTNAREGYKLVSWEDGLPVKVELWEDDSKNRKLWTRTYEYTDGVPTRIVVVNEDDGITVTKEITWQNGILTSINEV